MACLMSADLAAQVQGAPQETAVDISADEPPAQPARPASAGQLRTAPPPGFENISTRLDTLFDLSFRGRRVGSFRATVDEGLIRFEDPDRIVAALGAAVQPDTVRALLSRPLSLNEEFRCLPGETTGCGILPAGTSGVVVNLERFAAELFLARDFLSDLAPEDVVLGPPTATGFSFIQNANLSVAGEFGDGLVRYGGTFDTIASVGRTAFVGQTVLTDETGARLQEGYVQRLWTERRGAIGLLPGINTLTITNFRMLGAEYGSFFLRSRQSFETATPLEILLPRRAQVEVYRNGVLIYTQIYEAGLQSLDTSRLPTGSYPVQIIAREGGTVLVEETRTFTKVTDLPPPGKLSFTLRAGERVEDFFFRPIGGGGDDSFLPRRTGDLILGAAAQMRVGRASAIGAQVYYVGDELFAEGSLQTYRGRFFGLAAASFGSDGSYSGLVQGSLDLNAVLFSLSARRTRADDVAFTIDPRRFRPYFRSEDSVTAAASFRVLGGSATLGGTYTRSPFLEDQYTVTARYIRPLTLRGIGNVQLGILASASNVERRVAITFTHFRRVGRRSSLTATAGAEVLSRSNVAGRDGFAPIAQGTLSRADRWGGVELFSQVGAATGADSDRAFAAVQASSNRGVVDARLQYENRDGGSSSATYIFNGASGFAFGGGALQIGLRDPQQSIILVDIAEFDADGGNGQPAQVREQAVQPPAAPVIAQGGYRIQIENYQAGYVRSGRRAAIGLLPLDEYEISLQPDGAPQFNLDRTTERVTLYPGNVARVRFRAQRLVSLFGQAIDQNGETVTAGAVASDEDFTVTDRNGYFTITAPITSRVTVRRSDGSICTTLDVGAVATGQERAAYVRLGPVRCDE